MSLKTSMDGYSTTSLGSLFQYLTTHTKKKFFLVSNLDLPWHKLKPLPLVLSLALSPVTSHWNFIRCTVRYNLVFVSITTLNFGWKHQLLYLKNKKHLINLQGMVQACCFGYHHCASPSAIQSPSLYSQGAQNSLSTSSCFDRTSILWYDKR